MNNIYSMSSPVVMIGKKFFTFNRDDPDLKIAVISSLLKRSIIEKEIFNRSEACIVLQMAVDIQLKSKIPDLEYLIIKNFDEIRKQDFF